MSKIISFMHCSLDGFVAGPGGEMDWIKFDQDVFDHVGERIRQTDTALYGRITYQLMESYWPTAADKPNATKHDIEHAAWYKHAHRVVMSRTLKEDGLANTTIISGDLSNSIPEIKRRGEADILMFGSPMATHALMQLGLIDGYWLFVNPVILGRGMPLFADIRDTVQLNLISTRQFHCGVVELNYTVNG